jgi:hypothetical protein
MTKKLIAAFSEQLYSHIKLSKSRLETLALLITGMIGARTVNLSHIASDRGSMVTAAGKGPQTCRKIMISHRLRRSA